MRSADPFLTVIPSFQYRAKTRLMELSRLLVSLQLTEAWDNPYVVVLLQEARYLRHGLHTLLNPADLTGDEQRFICERLLPMIDEGAAFVAPPIIVDDLPPVLPLALTINALAPRIRGQISTGNLVISGRLSGTVPVGAQLVLTRNGEEIMRQAAIAGPYTFQDSSPGTRYRVLVLGTNVSREVLRSLVSPILYGPLPHAATLAQMLGLAVAPALVDGRLRLTYTLTRQRMYLLVPVSVGEVLAIKQPNDNNSDISAAFTHTTTTLDFGADGTDSYDVIEHYANFSGEFTLEAYFSGAVVIVPPVVIPNLSAVTFTGGVNTLLVAFTTNIAAATFELSVNGGMSYAPLTTTGTTNKTGTLRGVAARLYTAGELKLRPVGFPGAAVGNAGAVTVAATRTFVFFEGDSNTNGGEGTATTPYFTTLGQPFFKLLTARLGADYATFNAGTGGGTSTSRAVNLAARFDAAWTAAGKTAFPNAILYWMTGTNDPASAVTLTQAQTAISGLRGQMDSISTAIKIVLSSAIEPSFHQNGPTGQVYFQQLADWEAANWNGSLGAAAYYNLRGNTELSRLVTRSQAAAFGMPQNEDNFSLEMFGGVNGTGNGGVAFDAFHWGNFGHELYAQALLPVIQVVATGITPAAIPRPAAPTFGAIDDTANTVPLTPAAGVPLALYRYRLPGALTEYTVPGSGVIPAGNIAGKVVAFNVYGSGFAGSIPASSAAFTVTAAGATVAMIPFNHASISENATYAGAYSTATNAGSGATYRSVGRDPLLWYTHTSTKGGRLRWPANAAAFLGTASPSAMQLTVDGVLVTAAFAIVDGALVFDYLFTDGQTHTLRWYPVDQGQNNLYQFEAYV